MADDPEVWWRRLVDAAAAVQAGNKAAATEYLQWVESLKGRKVALRAKAELIAVAKSEKWQGCASWRENGYRPPSKKEVQRDRRAGRTRPAGR